MARSNLKKDTIILNFNLQVIEIVSEWCTIYTKGIVVVSTVYLGSTTSTFYK